MRTKPYTKRGLRRVPCVRCGKPSSEQFFASMCAMNGRKVWVGICAGCDADLNGMVLSFLKIPDTAGLMAEYRRKQGLA